MSIHEHTTDDLRETAGEIAHKAGRVAENVKEEAKVQYDRLETMIRRNPVASVSVAAGVGLLVAMLARR